MSDWHIMFEKRVPKENFIYIAFLKHYGLYKIGFSCNPKKRVYGLRCLFGKAHVFFYSFCETTVEKELHKLFKDKKAGKKKFTETFLLNKDDVRFAINYIKSKSINVK